MIESRGVILTNVSILLEIKAMCLLQAENIGEEGMADPSPLSWEWL